MSVEEIAGRALEATRPFLAAMDVKYGGLKLPQNPPRFFPGPLSRGPLSRGQKERRLEFYEAQRIRIGVTPHRVAQEAYEAGLYPSVQSAYRGLTHWRAV